MAVFLGWLGLTWILISTILSWNGLNNYIRRGTTILRLSGGRAVGRHLVIPALDALAILAVAVSSGMTGTITFSVAVLDMFEFSASPYYLAAVAWLLTLPFVIDVLKAADAKLHITTKLVLVRSVMLAFRLVFVFVMMFA